MHPSWYWILDANGEPKQINDWEAWAVWYERSDRIVALDLFEWGRVSTVFLGLDYGFGREPPILYETLVFGGPLAGECKRYATRTEALQGHAAMLERLKGR